jgi:penicillin-binding protein 1C
VRQELMLRLRRLPSARWWPRRRPLAVLAGLALGVIGCVLVLGLLTAVLRLVPRQPLSARVPGSTAVFDQKRRLLRLTLASDEKYRLWTPLREISPTLIEATLLHEDRHFYRHFAVNPVSLMRAVWVTYGRRDRRVGGSTITMQVARLLSHSRSRSALGKLRQIGRALWLELRYPKDEILEAYLNLVPCGKNIEGVPAASLIYFGKPASKLLLPEALALAVIPQSPARRASGHVDPSSQPDRLADGLADRQALWQARAALFEKWVKRHPEARKDEALVRLKVVLREPQQLPFRAPHFVDSVLRGPSLGRGDAAIVTTLDLPMQGLLERQLKAYVQRQRRLGIKNAAAMIVDTRDMGVRALVGSADFFDPSIEGQVNGALAKRSPGSTLKPFIYALGIDQGVLHPRTMLKDAQLSFGAYSPENFDGRFAGPLTAQEALVRSRNVPALWVASKLTNPSFYGFLRSAGVSRLKSEEHYGLALVLGGAEVTMDELAMLYATLSSSSRGLLRPLRWRQKDPAPPGIRVLSEEASFVTLEMLKDNPRPEDTLVTQALLNVGRVAWKTGTSYGFHDAWTAGVVGPYVLVVWLGNFSGEGNPAFVGVTAAAPLFFSVVDALAAQRWDLGEPVRALPKNLVRTRVCAVSGQQPTRHCPHTASTWFVPGRSPIEPCQIHRAVAIDPHTGLRACKNTAGLRTEVFEFWPSDLLRLFRIAGLPRRVPPPSAPGCDLTDAATRGVPPHITSPLRGVRYTLRPGADAHDTIALTATTDADAQEVFWFVNEALLGKVRSGSSLLWRPQAGRYIVRAVDDQGRADVREVEVDTAR